MSSFTLSSWVERSIKFCRYSRPSKCEAKSVVFLGKKLGIPKVDCTGRCKEKNYAAAIAALLFTHNEALLLGSECEEGSRIQDWKEEKEEEEEEEEEEEKEEEEEEEG